MPTTWTDVDPLAYLETVQPERRRHDARVLLTMMERVTGAAPRMFGPSIVGFREYSYTYDSGHSGHAPAAGFAPRKSATVVYLPDGLAAHEEDLAALGPYRGGVGCLYLTNLERVDLTVLERIIARSFATVTAAGFGRRAAQS
ncbi:DUF1801 domain-containing protein [Ruania zhangjianzhongii]|uniref:DUF1801 domain-containing protein n=1 Tax=Ruania zhangjianzhongii TaxID=2603206 RepID=UPI0011C92818|nr:DUF1801 domain-containing protein [Ruania zhangjianzhongii]